MDPRGKPMAAQDVGSGREGTRPLQAAFDRAPALRDGLIAFAVMMLIAAVLNDSGTAVPAFATMLALPLLIAACVRALELQDEDLPGGPPTEPPPASTRADALVPELPGKAERHQ